MKKSLLCLIYAMLLLAFSPFASAVVPDVKTVPWVASNPLVPHSTISGEPHTLKGTADLQGGAPADFEWTWDPGDGSPVYMGTVSDPYNISAVHTYTGAAGTVFTAKLTVEETATGDTQTENYFVEIQAASLGVEVNMAIDAGLWYIHTQQRRDAVFAGSGDWPSGFVGNSRYAMSAMNVLALEVNGHLESGSADNPYTETVERGLKNLFHRLRTHAVADQTNTLGTFSPDGDGNGYGVVVNQGDPYYQGGIFMDAIVASGTPAAVTTTGPTGVAPDPGVVGRTYKEIVQDMVDEYAWAQYDGSTATTGGGGWRYGANTFPDNSACQWAAIGIIAAERNFGCTIDQGFKDFNKVWLDNSQDTSGGPTDGVFGYTSPSPIWGPTATTPSGTVQLAWVGVGRGDAQWDRSETQLRTLFPDPVAGNDARNELLDNYYGLFSFTKSMLLHDPDGNGVSDPIVMLGGDLDWYAAEGVTVDGVVTDGVARTLVDDQDPAGYWWAHAFNGQKYPLETAMCCIMLNRTVFDSGVPVAVADANPNPAVASQTINLDGSSSFHQDAARTIVDWDWDLNNDGTYETPGVTATTSFPAVGDYPVGLQVTDDMGTTAATTVIVRVDTPPLAPTANAGGPYFFCPGYSWFLDGSGSSNADEGQSEPGQPGDTIREYAWELDGDNDFNDAFGPNPDVSALFPGPGSYLVQLRVTDTTATSFPSSGLGDLTDTDSAQVVVLEATDSRCDCIDDLAARPKRGKVQLTWTHTGAAMYLISRSTTDGGPYTPVDVTDSTHSVFIDKTVVNGTTYYYVVKELAGNGDELCQSDQVSATPRVRGQAARLNDRGNDTPGR